MNCRFGTDGDRGRLDEEADVNRRQPRTPPPRCNQSQDQDVHPRYLVCQSSMGSGREDRPVRSANRRALARQGPRPGRRNRTSRGGRRRLRRGRGALRLPRRNERRQPAAGRRAHAVPVRLDREDVPSAAIVRLVEEGKVDLDAPVRTYVPELTLTDEVAQRVTVLQLFNHTAGWEGDVIEDTGDGDDALEKYVARMAMLQQVTPPGFTVSYNNASLGLAGRIIEKVTGTTYEQAIGPRARSARPDETFFFPNDIMTRRFAVGHTQDDGGITIARPWAMPRGGNAMVACPHPLATRSAGPGSTSMTGRPRTGRGSSGELLDRMQEPTAEMHGCDLGDDVGIAGCCATSTARGSSPTADRQRASSRHSRWCRRADSRSSRSRTPSRTVRSSTIASASGRSRPI